MAATRIVTKNSTTPGKVPAAGDLVRGELAVSLADQKLYTKDQNDEIIQISDSVEVSETAPTGATISNGSLWYNSDDGEGGGRLYVYYEDADSGQWIDASPDMQISEYWQRDGSGNLSPLKPNDNIVAGANAVKLQSNGTGSFTGKVTSASTASGDPGGTLVTKDFVQGRTSGDIGFWNRTGTDLSPANSGDNIDDVGNITAAGVIQAGDNPVNGANEGTAMGDYGGFNACRDKETSSVFQGYTTGNSTATINMLATGAATFAGNIQAGDYPFPGADNGSLMLQAGGFVTTSDNAAAQLYRSYTKGNNSPTFQVTAAGNITAAGNLQTGENTGSVIQNKDGTIVGANGFIDIYKDSSNINNFLAGYKTGATDPRFSITADGSITASGDVKIGGTLPSAPNIELKASDGNADFAGSVDVRDTVNVQATGNPASRVNLTASTGEIFCANSSKDSTKMFRIQGGRGTAAQEDVVAMTSSGSITAAGLFTLVNANKESKVELFTDGIAYFGNTITSGVSTGSSGTSLAFVAAVGNDQNVQIQHNGNAVFQGTVTADNVSFNLDADDPNAYETREEQYTEIETYKGPRGNELLTREVTKTREVTEYVGETMLVKETLLKITGALEGLKAAAASATTCEELRGAIETALADV